MPTSGLDRKASGSVVSKHTEGLLNGKGFEKRTSWNVPASTLSKNTRNVIREIVEKLKLTPNPEKPMIPLSIGKFIVFAGVADSLRFRNWLFEIFILCEHCVDNYLRGIL